ncbi:hypothetical protein FQN57_000450 [Myotisia sp. PD_48]|nr:hypothetical protein FQN57_000450 [Myotisia sp. PD_48]
MQISHFLRSVFLFAPAILATPKPPTLIDPSTTIQTEIFYQTISSNPSTSKPSHLAQISYDPSTSRTIVLSYTPPSTGPDASLVRVGLYPEPNRWVGITTSVSALSQSQISTDQEQEGGKNLSVPTLLLYLDASNKVYSVGVAPSSSSSSASRSNHDGEKSAGVNVEFVRYQTAPSPVLNKPVARKVGGDGQDGEEEEPLEKTMLQK